jgi:hypothetical protein
VELMPWPDVRLSPRQTMRRMERWRAAAAAA